MAEGMQYKSNESITTDGNLHINVSYGPPQGVPIEETSCTIIGTAALLEDVSSTEKNSAGLLVHLLGELTMRHATEFCDINLSQRTIAAYQQALGEKLLYQVWFDLNGNTYNPQTVKTVAGRNFICWRGTWLEDQQLDTHLPDTPELSTYLTKYFVENIEDSLNPSEIQTATEYVLGRVAEADRDAGLINRFEEAFRHQNL